MRTKKILAFMTVACMLFAGALVMMPLSSAEDPPNTTTRNYGGLTLNSPWTDTHYADVWDLTQGDLTLSYTIDMTGLHQPGTWETYDGSTSYTEVGLRGEGAGNFNPGPWNTYQGNCGGWMVSDDDTWNDGDGFTERGNPDPDSIADLDDKHGLQASGGRGERDYDVLLSDMDTVLSPTIGSWSNYGIWFDRDGVDPWQDNDPLTPAPGGSSVPWSQQDGRKTYDTGGIYQIEILYHAIDANGNGDKTDDGLGVMFATINGVPQGFYTSWHEGQPDYYPAGLSFKGDMEHMQVFAGLWAPDASYGPIVLSDLEVTGYLGVSDPLVADFDYTFSSDVLSPGDTVQFTDKSHGGMAPYTYLWDFGDGTTSTEQNPSHVYSTAGSYTVKLIVTPFRCTPTSYQETITVVETGFMTVTKYYDANTNGVQDVDEPEIAGWKVLIDGDEYFTPVVVELPLGDHTVTEIMPDGCSWVNTGALTVEITVSAPDWAMYANDYAPGGALAVHLDPYNPPGHALRLNPANALGPFDALPGDTSLNTKFLGVASQESIEFTFEDRFWNVNGKPDIDFAEVTWSAWHTEAALVYLTGAYVWDGNDIVPYGTTDDGIGYYAGIVWNKVGILGIDASTRETIAEKYLGGVTRDFEDNVFSTNGNIGISGFNLPSEVVYATGIVLVDITAEVYGVNTIATSLFAPATFLNVGGTGQAVQLATYDPFTFIELGIVNGNTDGYDLDAIRVYGTETYEVSFGNVCLGPGGGHTPGYWSNKNGQATMNDGDTMEPELEMLRNLNLKDKMGGDFDPTTYSAFKGWLLKSEATNMAYKLSSSLAAMTLNVEAGFVDPEALVYAPCVDGTNAAGFISIADLIEEANAALGANGFTPAGDEDRAYQECLNKALDLANNNWTFVQAEPCCITYL